MGNIKDRVNTIRHQKAQAPFMKPQEPEESKELRQNLETHSRHREQEVAQTMSKMELIRAY